MEASELIGLLAVGLAAGLASGLLGIGGGVLFVPGLVVFLDLGLLEAEATSLVAITIVALVGTWRQRGHGNVRLRDGVALGLLSPLGVAAGVLLANALPVRALELGFAAVQVYFAYELMRRALRARAGSERATAGESA
jgi:uncharacterized membrane protein YfcA